jgi:hypothetical protein
MNTNSFLGCALPPSSGLVGQSFAVQGLGVGDGSCLGAPGCSDTFQFTIRFTIR